MPDLNWKQKGAVYFDAKLYINVVQIVSLQEHHSFYRHKYLHDDYIAEKLALNFQAFVLEQPYNMLWF